MKTVLLIPWKEICANSTPVIKKKERYQRKKNSKRFLSLYFDERIFRWKKIIFMQCSNSKNKLVSAFRSESVSGLNVFVENQDFQPNLILHVTCARNNHEMDMPVWNMLIFKRMILRCKSPEQTGFVAFKRLLIFVGNLNCQKFPQKSQALV